MLGSLEPPAASGVPGNHTEVGGRGALPVPPDAASVPVDRPLATAPRKRACCSAVPAWRTTGTNCVAVARKGPGAMTRPSSSTTTPSSTNPSPTPPWSAGTVRPGQPSSTMCCQSASAGSPRSTAARTRPIGHSRARKARTDARSACCSSVNSSSTRQLRPVVRRRLAVLPLPAAEALSPLPAAEARRVPPKRPTWMIDAVVSSISSRSIPSCRESR